MMNPNVSISSRIHPALTLRFCPNRKPQRFDKESAFSTLKYDKALRSISLLLSQSKKSSCFSLCRNFTPSIPFYRKSSLSNHSETQMLNLCDFFTFLTQVLSMIRFHRRFGPFFKRNKLVIRLKCLD